MSIHDERIDNRSRSIEGCQCVALCFAVENCEVIGRVVRHDSHAVRKEVAEIRDDLLDALCGGSAFGSHSLRGNAVDARRLLGDLDSAVNQPITTLNNGARVVEQADMSLHYASCFGGDARRFGIEYGQLACPRGEVKFSHGLHSRRQQCHYA